MDLMDKEKHGIQVNLNYNIREGQVNITPNLSDGRGENLHGESFIYSRCSNTVNVIGNSESELNNTVGGVNSTPVESSKRDNNLSKDKNTVNEAKESVKSDMKKNNTQYKQEDIGFDMSRMQQRKIHKVKDFESHSRLDISESQTIGGDWITYENLHFEHSDTCPSRRNRTYHEGIGQAKKIHEDKFVKMAVCGYIMDKDKNLLITRRPEWLQIFP